MTELTRPIAHGYNACGAGRQIRVKPRQGREAATVDVFLWVSCIALFFCKKINGRAAQYTNILGDIGAIELIPI